jgi:chromosome segregation ATPase
MTEDVSPDDKDVESLVPGEETDEDESTSESDSETPARPDLDVEQIISSLIANDSFLVSITDKLASKEELHRGIVAEMSTDEMVLTIKSSIESAIEDAVYKIVSKLQETSKALDNLNTTIAVERTSVEVLHKSVAATNERIDDLQAKVVATNELSANDDAIRMVNRLSDLSNDVDLAFSRLSEIREAEEALGQAQNSIIGWLDRYIDLNETETNVTTIVTEADDAIKDMNEIISKWRSLRAVVLQDIADFNRKASSVVELESDFKKLADKVADLEKETKVSKSIGITSMAIDAAQTLSQMVRPKETCKPQAVRSAVKRGTSV